ncbi:hypothetical protein [Pseudomarimonas arenosa]|uniref:Uncharacterized protein n=1 Tax=Pseudomarimonas arenosa TaxID=2774145 RepID=A0AAW3ZKF4_9GAMM|nr:hypothetical protein [Pseudomarimonas arenosa]MBD8526223.1 hypothetical protein [Pseudomarimonas arenosa]
MNQKNNRSANRSRKCRLSDEELLAGVERTHARDAERVRTGEISPSDLFAFSGLARNCVVQWDWEKVVNFEGFSEPGPDEFGNRDPD